MAMWPGRLALHTLHVHTRAQAAEAQVEEEEEEEEFFDHCKERPKETCAYSVGAAGWWSGARRRRSRGFFHCV